MIQENVEWAGVKIVMCGEELLGFENIVMSRERGAKVNIYFGDGGPVKISGSFKIEKGILDPLFNYVNKKNRTAASKRLRVVCNKHKINSYYNKRLPEWAKSRLVRDDFSIADIRRAKEMLEKKEIAPYDNEDRKFIMDYFDKQYRDYMYETSGVELPPGALWKPCHVIK